MTKSLRFTGGNGKKWHLSGSKIFRLSGQRRFSGGSLVEEGEMTDTEPVGHVPF
jgi:hypothetical protein